MSTETTRIGVRIVACSAFVTATMGLLACVERPLQVELPQDESGIQLNVPVEGVDTVDLLMMVDNSNSMRDNQTQIMQQFGPLIATLTSPPCTNPNNAMPHTCDPSNPADTPQYPPVRDLHVGVVSSDLGTPGSMVPTCGNAPTGDDGVLNPIRNGGALLTHEPWVGSPSFGRPTDCTDPNEFPTFIEFVSGGTGCDPSAPSNQCTTDAATFTHNFECNAGLYVAGCGLESQLEAVYRALTFHNNADPTLSTTLQNWPGGDNANGGFLRPNALLAILMLSDEDDMSVRNVAYQEPGQPPVNDATDVYASTSTNWSSANLNLRSYMYAPGGPQDPTWSMDRYFDPSNPNRGFPGLKPGHPERVVFAAITGLPVGLGTDPSGATDWNALLGPVPPGHSPDDFNSRDSTMAHSDTSMPEGPISMQHANLDPNCSQRTVPACRRIGTTYAPTNCTPDQQYFAWPSRRIIELARRFDQDPLCDNGSNACANGFVSSICEGNYQSAMQGIVAKIEAQIHGTCLTRQLQSQVAHVMNHTIYTVQCTIIETEPVGVDSCDASHGRTDPPGPNGVATPQYTTVGGQRLRQCAITQVPTIDLHTPATGLGLAENGWYYDQQATGGGATCAHRISYTSGDAPAAATSTNLECIESVSGIADAGAGG